MRLSGLMLLMRMGLRSVYKGELMQCLADSVWGSVRLFHLNSLRPSFELTELKEYCCSQP